MTPDQEALLTELFRTVLGDDALQLHDRLTAKDVPSWDSFNHVNLMLHIETQFKIRFANDEIASLRDVGELKQLIDRKLAG